MPPQIRNFTPVLDSLVEKYGLITAAVWGRVWRYEQAADKVCRASNAKLAAGLGISDRTVIRHLATLIEAGYIIDHSPNLKNKPHTLTTTEKARLEVSIEATDDGVTESQSEHSTMTESHSTMTESHSHYDRESHEETNKKQGKKKDSSPNGDRAAEKKKTAYVERSELLEQVFAEARGCPLPDWEGDPKESNKRWRTPLNRMLKATGGDIEKTTRGIGIITERMIRDRLTFTAPDQIEESFKAWLLDGAPSLNGYKRKVNRPVVNSPRPVEVYE